MPTHDVPAGRVLRIGTAVALVIAASIAAVFLLLHHWQVPADADLMQGSVPTAAAGPSLQNAPQPDLDAYRAEKQRQLDSFGWVDRQHGIVHIPIQSAMEMLAHPPETAASASQVQR